MIRQNFDIDSNEVVRILRMHENATKSHYLLNEQVKKTTQLPPKEFSLPAQTFKSGYHSESSLNPSQKQAIESVLNQMANYIAEKKGIPMSIQIVTGESIPKNYDNENKVSLEKGELARLRGETMRSVLTKFFQGLVDKKIIPSMPSIPNPQTNVELGMKQVPYTKGTDDPKDEKYEVDQFIKFSIVSSGQETTQCLLGLNVIVQYVEQTSPQLPCRGNHACNEAMFDVYLNTTLIGVADLNNAGCYGDDCDRRSSLVVTQEMVNSIVNKPGFNNRLTLWYKCKSRNCHSSVPEIYIYNDKKEKLFPNSNFPNACVAPQAARGDGSSKILMFLDGCGNPISVDQTTSAEEMRRLGDEMMSPEEKLSKEQKELLQKFFKDVQTKGLSFIPGRPNTNIFNTDIFEVSETTEQGNMLLVTVTSKQNISVSSFLNPYTNKAGSYFAKKGIPFKVLVPIVPVNIQKKERVFKKDNPNLIQVGDVGFFSPYAVDNIKGTQGVIVKPTFVSQ